MRRFRTVSMKSSAQRTSVLIKKKKKKICATFRVNGGLRQSLRSVIAPFAVITRLRWIEAVAKVYRGACA